MLNLPTMINRFCILLVAGCVCSCNSIPPNPPDSVGASQSGGTLVSTQQLIRPAGQSVEFPGRPVDLVLSPDGATLYAKDDRAILAIDAATWKIRQQLPFADKEGGTMHGLALSGDGTKLFTTTTTNRLREISIANDGKLTWARSIDLKAESKTNVYPCGLALTADVKTACVCLSMANTLAMVNLTNGKLEAQIPVGVAPYAVAFSKDHSLAYVSNWGGRRAKKGDKTAKSAGTDTVVDERGVASTGTISIVDLKTRKELTQIAVGLHPADLKLSSDGARLYVANANSDSVSVIDTTSQKVIETIQVRPDPTLPFGSASNALTLSPDDKTLYVANGGNNAVAVVSLNLNAPAHVEGFIPAGWYPGAVAIDHDNLFIANVKGLGSRREKPKQKGWTVQQYQGTISKVPLPTSAELANYTQQVLAHARVPQSLAAWEKAQADAPPRPVPQHAGEPSLFEHIVYVIKENRTYDQVLGDIGKGNSDPRLCVFNKHITPNLHALANDFVLLDNFYCNGVISADGHAWVTEGLAVDYLEKAFGGFTRSYPFSGDDPLAFASTGFIWDNVLLHGRSFRNYGEMSKTEIQTKGAGFTEIYSDLKNSTKKVALKQTVYIDLLRRYSCLDYPGWNLKVPDAVRMNVFMKEFEQAKARKEWPNFITVYLPSDHTSGTTAGDPTPAAMAADNDLAVGQLVDAISHSSFWPKTCIFIIEDDPQAGFDHVDGHRSVCWVISPYTKRGQIVSDFYNQTSVLHTMELMLGLPPMNQLDAMAPVMTNCFVDQPNLAPYTVLPNNIPLNQMNPKKAALTGPALEFAEKSDRLDFTEPDKADENTLNRILWQSLRGNTDPYPAEFAGAHGRGLRSLKLKPIDDDDD